MTRFLRRIWYLVNRRRLERDLADEMDAHREMMPPEDRAAFGRPLHIREDAREVWGWGWLDRIFQDLTYGARILRKSPGFTLTAILVLALGIGVNLTAFRIVLAEFAPTVRDPATLVHLDRWFPNGHGNAVAYPVLAFYADHAKSFRAVMAEHSEHAIFGDTPAGRDPHSVSITFVTANYFAEQGDPIAYGRALSPAIDEAPGAEPAALLSYEFWEQNFARNAAVIGQTIRLNGKPVRIVGILHGPHEGGSAVWMPIVKQPYLVDGSKLLVDWKAVSVQGTARLNPGVTPRAAEEESRALAARLREDRPDDVAKDERLALTSFNSLRLHPDEIAPLVMSIVLVLLILAVACANLGTLLLARGVTREREIRTRLALGATRRRVVRQLLTESALLAVLGGAAALFLSSLAIAALQSVNEAPDALRDLADWRVLAATAMAAVLALGVFGLAPALRLTSSAPHGGRSRAIFLAAQVGASCILLMVSGLLVRSIDRLLVMDPGFDYRKIVSISPGLHAHGYDGAAAKQYLDALGARVRTMPGVEQASIVWLAPWGHTSSGATINSHLVHINHVDPDFLQTLGIRLVRGRNFMPGEQGVALVSESLARWHWPGQDPLGKSLTDIPGVVVGVVKTAGTFEIREEDPMGIYFSMAPGDYGSASLAVRVKSDPARVAGAIVGAARNQNPKLQPSYDLLEKTYDDAVSQSRVLATAIGLLGTLATLLAAIGLAGLAGYTVGQRTGEIGVRMALGAGKVQIVRSVLRPMVVPVMTGLVGGMFGAAGISSVLRGVVFGLRPLDPLAYVMALMLFGVVVGLAILSPATRAFRVQPAEALRHE